MRDTTPSVHRIPPEVLRQLLPELEANIKGQREALRRLVSAALRREYWTIPRRGCRDAFFLAGPTGVGKTEAAVVLSRHLFGDKRLVRFDSSEFKTVERVMALLDDPHRHRGRFGQAHARVAEGVWLFDEIEKGHGEFVDLFLQMLDEGRITLANGEVLDLSGVYIVVTSNLGSAAILGCENLPFTSLEEHVVRAIQNHLRPELLGRFGAPFVFRPLSRPVQLEITELHLGRLLEWQTTQGRHVTCDPGVAEFVLQRGFSRTLGARPLLDTLNELVGDAIVTDLEHGGNGSGNLLVAGEVLLLAR